MEFRKFSSLENAYRQKFINACHELGIAEWVAMEKIHGANFSFICDENMEVVPAKRTGLVEVNGSGNYNFYGCNPVVDKYAEKVKELANVIGGPIQLFGELYGEGVQKEVAYGPKDFIAYDIMLRDGTFLDWPMVKDLCMIFGIPTTPELGRGTLEEMLDIDPEFMSRLCSDPAEGVVIKPLHSGLILSTGSRPIIKNKSKAFSEKKEVKAKKPQTVPEELQAVFDDFCAYLNDNRLSNVISKLGTVSQKDFGKLTGLLVQDALEEFERDEYPVDKDDWKKLQKFIGKEASGVVRADWLNILDNNAEITQEV